ncbi:putative cyst matrix protein [Neospora caninum Liverpool]|uniref:Cyst matrix protein, putative n=2 Tax=Neospora caninum TaxID=29176 RepID=F0VJE8_NEOCL|nr:putative cyst matrix protein [Neospora caninum Liverpool]ABQ52425.1 cyst matrix and cyst wall protein [Neospora caninum]CBZ53859.1 putative cyst matrix protein [Neospora caninum Liverpool]CEL67854.1 TPA: cyst matrix protein, putative [Neospora caninum Liverpool]|eukprot:XP_003883891.1 putative cyst matrix protein [Neospora caninum Liverpool]
MAFGRGKRGLHAAVILGFFVLLATSSVGLGQRVPRYPSVESLEERVAEALGRRSSAAASTLPGSDTNMISDGRAGRDEPTASPEHHSVDAPTTSGEGEADAGKVTLRNDEGLEGNISADHVLHPPPDSEHEGLQEPGTTHQEAQEPDASEAMDSSALPLSTSVPHPNEVGSTPGTALPAPIFSIPELSPEEVVYVLRVQGSGDFEISFQVGRVVRQLEAIKRAYREAHGKLEAEELESERGPTVSTRTKLVDFIKENQRRLRAAFQKVKIQQKLEEIEELLQLSHALKSLGARLRPCQKSNSPMEEEICRKTKALGEMVAQKAEDLRQHASTVSALLGREAVERQLRRVDSEQPYEQTDAGVAARAEEFRKALEKAASGARQFVGTTADEIVEEVKEDAQYLRDGAKEVLTKSQRALVDAFQAIQRALLEAKAKELVDAASKEAEDARKILAEQPA